MTGDDFTAWMAHMGWNIGKVAETLQIGRNTVPKYMREGAPAHIGYACAALAFGLPAWTTKR